MRKILLYTSVGLLLLLIIMAATFQYSRSWQNAFFIQPIYQIAGKEKVVALTFDDGPSALRTPTLLQLLDTHKVKATFFMLGENIEKHPDIAQEVIEKGHLVGNHSFDHPRLIFKSYAFIEEQITKTDKLIEDLGQKEIRYFRPPYSSKYLILPLVLKSLNKELVTGSYDPPSQYLSPYNAKKTADEVIANIQPGAIIYLHDGKSTDPKPFVKSVEHIINGLKKQGYQFVRLDGIE